MEDTAPSIYAMIVMLRLNGVLRYGSQLWTVVSSAVVTAVDSGSIDQFEALKSGMICVSNCLHVLSAFTTADGDIVCWKVNLRPCW